MVQAMYSAVSGVQAHQTRLDAIGNNIANVNTVGYKAAQVTFQEQMSQTYRGASMGKSGSGGTNPMQVGLGVKLGAITTVQTQGALQQTGRPSDLSLQGDGFFLVGDGSTTAYTRDGAFVLDAGGNLVSAATGQKLLGWPAQLDGTVNTSVPVTSDSSIRVPIGTMTAAKATTSVTFGGNLDAGAAVGDVYTRTAQVFDSLGNAHEVAFRFQRSAGAAPGASAWDFTTAVDGGTFSAPGAAGSGTLAFDASGKLTAANGSLTVTPANGAAPFTITPDFGGVSQLAGDYTTNALEQDGFSLGALQSYAIAEDGTVTGVFSNGMNRDLGRIAVARFANETGLEKIGANMFRPTANSGGAQVTPPDTSGAGRIAAGYLEQSNVSLADEFSNMIITQRGFQANTRIVTAADEILQDLIQMKR